jgi:tetratricopeptide (TPR) repeat protein
VAEYHVSGRSSEGRNVVDCIEANSAVEAVELFEQRGFTDIVLHSSDVEASVRRQMNALYGRKNTRRVLTPREFVHRRKNGGYFTLILLLFPKAFKYGWWSIILTLVVLAIRVVYTRQLGGHDFASIATIVAPLIALTITVVFGNYGKYRRLIEARAWGRWEQVLALLPSMERRLPASQIGFHRAVALAGLDRLDEALAGYEQYENDKHLPQWMYWSHVSSVYAAGGSGEGAVRAMEKAAALAPTQPSVLVGYAISLMRRRRDPRRARQVLDQATKFPITDAIAYSLDLCRGLIALDENQPFEAREHLERALAKVLEFRNANALMGASRDRIHACLAIANAATGDYEEALRHYRIAKPRLLALRYDDLAERCEAALGLTANQ